jgi:hypothetical protein
MHADQQRLVTPSAERNKGPIGELLQRVFPEHAFVLEIASGTGQHVMHFARMMSGITWQPSEHDPVCSPAQGAAPGKTPARMSGAAAGSRTRSRS